MRLSSIYFSKPVDSLRNRQRRTDVLNSRAIYECKMILGARRISLYESHLFWRLAEAKYMSYTEMN